MKEDFYGDLRLMRLFIWLLESLDLSFWHTETQSQDFTKLRNKKFVRLTIENFNCKQNMYVWILTAAVILSELITQRPFRLRLGLSSYYIYKDAIIFHFNVFFAYGDQSRCERRFIQCEHLLELFLLYFLKLSSLYTANVLQIFFLSTLNFRFIKPYYVVSDVFSLIVLYVDFVV